MKLAQPRLLITDDDANLRETLKTLLEERGYATVAAEDGEQAINIVRHETIHIVLLDMHMPRLTGLETLQEVKRLKALLPCILMSAELDDQIIERAKQIAFDILAKPFSFRQVETTLQRALQACYHWPNLADEAHADE
ncbi:MAG: response regulator [Planctomycetota bacterium]|nr:MAG: response regulator [Planctomycetota bacterium]